MAVTRILSTLAFIAVVENPRRARENYAPDDSFATMNGEFLSSEDLPGKVVLIDFWATWCGPSVHATPALARIQRIRRSMARHDHSSSAPKPRSSNNDPEPT